MNTYNEHYQQCKRIFESKNEKANILNLDFIENIFDVKDPVFDDVVDEVGQALDRQDLVVYREFSKHIKEPRNMPSLRTLAKQITEQIEEQIFGCYFNIEFIHCYENLYKETQESSSWLWHFDNCPDECVKVAFHINSSNKKNGCMKILVDKDDNPLRMKTDRISPKDKSRRSSRIAYSHIKSLKQIGYTEKEIIGNRGSNFVFSPNILHKATIPTYNTDNRKILMFYVRPSLTKNKDPFINTRLIDGVDVKEYKLN